MLYIVYVVKLRDTCKYLHRVIIVLFWFLCVLFICVGRKGEIPVLKNTLQYKYKGRYQVVNAFPEDYVRVIHKNKKLTG